MAWRGSVRGRGVRRSASVPPSKSRRTETVARVEREGKRERRRMDPSSRSRTGPTGSPRSVNTGTPFEYVRLFATLTCTQTKESLVSCVYFPFSLSFSLSSSLFLSHSLFDSLSLSLFLSRPYIYIYASAVCRNLVITVTQFPRNGL